MDIFDQAGFERMFVFYFFWYENLHSSLLQGACQALNNAALKELISIIALIRFMLETFNVLFLHLKHHVGSFVFLSLCNR